MMLPSWLMDTHMFLYSFSKHKMNYNLEYKINYDVKKLIEVFTIKRVLSHHHVGGC